MVRIRLRRMGLRSRPTYRLVVIDSRKARDGEYIEQVGNYNPRNKHLELKGERVDYWISRGGQPSDTVARLIKRYFKQRTPTAEATAVPAAPEPAPAAAEPAPAEPVVEPEPETNPTTDTTNG